jgi:tetratricopeptide (TPR) repeat protein
MDQDSKARPAGNPAETRSRLIGIALLAALLWAYYPIYHADFVNYDDGLYVIDNAHIRDGLTAQAIAWAFGTFYAANWHPLTLLSHLIDFQLYGMNAAGHHLTNVIFHIGNTLLLFLVLRLMTGALWRSALVAFLFALHPLHVESVAWVSERKDVLSTFFMFLALLAWRRYVRDGGWRPYGLTALCFVLGLLSKPMLVTFPFLLVLLDFWPLGRVVFPDRGRRFYESCSRALIANRRLAIEKLPFFILGILASVITLLAQSQAGAVSSVEAVPLGIRFANALVSFTQYIVHLLVPTGLGVFYPHPGAELEGRVVLASLGFILLVTWLCLRMRREKPYLLVGWLWYAGMLVPVIGIVQVGMQAMADRYTYLPLIGVFIMLSWTLPDLRFRRKGAALAAVALLAAVAVLLVMQTRRQVGYWMNTGTLFSRTDEVTRNNVLAKLISAAQLGQQGKTQLAREKYEEVLRISPRNVTAHHHYGMFLASRGALAEGIGHLKEAVALQPDSVTAQSSLGLVLMWSGETGAAERHLREALRLKPDRPETHESLAQLHEKTGDYEKALRSYQEALRLKPAFSRARLALALLLDQLGRTQEAKSHYGKVIKEDPHAVAEMHFTLGRSLAGRGKLEDAVAQYRSGLQIEPANTESLGQLAELLQARGDLPAAMACYREIVRLKPGHEGAVAGMGAVLTAQGKFDEAAALFHGLIAEKGQSVSGRIGLGRALAGKGLLADAAAAYRSALAIDSEAHEAHYELGVALRTLGRTGEAASHLQKALTLKPDHGQARAALKALRDERGLPVPEAAGRPGAAGP